MILFRYILKTHFAPFLFATFTLIAVFLLQFMMKFADRLVGKGLSAWIIIKLVAYNLAWMVVLVVPMAVLVATLMAFGSMAQNNEVTIMKSSGISLYKMMIPPLAASIVIAFLLIEFNNNVYPDSNHTARLLLQDISRKKPTLSLVPGVFSREVDNYAILVRAIDQNNNELKQVTIYDYSNQPKVNIVTAETGKIYFSENQKKLIMDLNNGEIHESDNLNPDSYRKLRFRRHKIAMPGEQFTFEQSTPGGPRNDRELGAKEMIAIVDSIKLINDDVEKKFDTRLNGILNPDTSGVSSTSPASFGKSVYYSALDKLTGDENAVKNFATRINFNEREMDSYWVEIHKKYSIPFACLVFVLIGAPLGTMIRKGGFGMAAGISLVFFMIYWAFLIGGEKLADRNLLSPMWGMWSANVVLGILGILLTIKSARERVTISFEFFQKLLPKQWRLPADTDENT